MSDRITANSPARDFDERAAFYGAFGFAVAFRDEGGMILRRGDCSITSPADEAHGLTIFALVDVNGSLLRCMSAFDASAQAHRPV